jgi:hypothetical protein
MSTAVHMEPFHYWLQFLLYQTQVSSIFIVRSQQSVTATFNRKILQSVLDFPNKIFLTIKFSRCRIFLSVFIIVYIYEAEFEQKVKKSLTAGTCRQNKAFWFRNRAKRSQIINVPYVPRLVLFILCSKSLNSSISIPS